MRGDMNDRLHMLEFVMMLMECKCECKCKCECIKYECIFIVFLNQSMHKKQ